MGRGKVKLELVEKPAESRDALRRRGDGLRKKARELGTLCGVDVCVVAYGDEPSSSQQAPAVVWPEDTEQAARAVERFKAMPEAVQRRKMLDGASLLRERVTKLQQRVRRAETGRRERETKLLLHDAIVGRRPGLEGLIVRQLVSAGWMAEDRVRKIKERIAQLHGQQHNVVQPAPPQPPPPPPYPYATTAADVASPPFHDTTAVVVVSPPPPPHVDATAFIMDPAPSQRLLMEVLKD